MISENKQTKCKIGHFINVFNFSILSFHQISEIHVTDCLSQVTWKDLSRHKVQNHNDLISYMNMYYVMALSVRLHQVFHVFLDSCNSPKIQRMPLILVQIYRTILNLVGFPQLLMEFWLFTISDIQYIRVVFHWTSCYSLEIQFIPYQHNETKAVLIVLDIPGF